MPEANKGLRIYKYPFAVSDMALVKIEGLKEILHLGHQGVQLCLWALVDLDDTSVTKLKLRVFGTDHEIPRKDLRWLTYIGTVQMGGDGLREFVWHVYREG